MFVYFTSMGIVFRCTFLITLLCVCMCVCCIATDKKKIFVFSSSGVKTLLYTHIACTHIQFHSTCKPHLHTLPSIFFTPVCVCGCRLFIYLFHETHNERGIRCMFAFILIGYLVILWELNLLSPHYIRSFTVHGLLTHVHLFTIIILKGKRRLCYAHTILSIILAFPRMSYVISVRCGVHAFAISQWYAICFIAKKCSYDFFTCSNVHARKYPQLMKSSIGNFV